MHAWHEKKMAQIYTAAIIHFLEMYKLSQNSCHSIVYIIISIESKLIPLIICRLEYIIQTSKICK